MPHNWNAFLQHLGAQFDGQEVLQFTQTSNFTAWEGGFLVSLSHLGLISAEGEQAAEFLHNQLSNDVKALTTDAARLAAYCTPKGRMLASMLLFRSDSHIFLQMPQTVLPPLLKRLKMFVMRSKAVLQDASESLVTLGLGGTNADSALQPWFPQLPQQAWGKVSNEYGDLIRMPDAFGAPRYQWLLGFDLAEAIWPQLAAKLAPAPNRIWRLAEIEAGIPHILPPTQEQFVPQMINFELIGGVNFKKGCYPGQEIVARSQYLGKLKRRMQLASLDGTQLPLAGQELFSEQDPEQPCGMVVNAEPALAGGYRALVEMKIHMLQSAVHLASISGPLLQFGALPYSIESQE